MGSGASQPEDPVAYVTMECHNLCQNPAEPGWTASLQHHWQQRFEDVHRQAGPSRKVARISVRPVTMWAPAPQCAAERFSTLPDCKLTHTSIIIRYTFFDGCKNIPAFHILEAAGTRKVYKGSAYCPPHLKSLLPFFTFPMQLEEQAQGLEHFPASKKRLPVFRQLCGEAVPGIHQDPSQGLKKLPDAKAPREDSEDGRTRQAAGCFPPQKA
ncbi:hypothetical protein AAES_73300 [Amazona aestiva]|uniref:Uncharacterized protein n=1 Tax=Amazona aestiva TaxID=12930 RepID=A0A0Q3Q1Y1_AMAAE|nr:hypothetical protein AAES_73300 [Amazona aestiva]